MTQKIYRLIFILWLGLLTCVVSCQQNVVTATTTQDHTLPAVTTEPTNTETVQPSFTPTATNTPIPTTMPTLMPDEALRLVLEQLETNGGCELPCWWGITPGETSVEEVRMFLNTFSFSEDYFPEHKLMEFSFQVPENISTSTYLRQVYIFEEDIIELMQVRTGNVQNYNLSNLLMRLGVPTEVRIDIWSPGYEEDFSFVYYLYYPHKGVLVQLSSSAIVTSEIVYGCPQVEKDFYPILALWQPNEIMTFFERIQEPVYVGSRTENMEELYPLIEEISELDASEFYEIYYDLNSDYCFQTPRDVWPDIMTGTGH